MHTKADFRFEDMRSPPNCCTLETVSGPVYPHLYVASPPVDALCYDSEITATGYRAVHRSLGPPTPTTLSCIKAVGRYLLGCHYPHPSPIDMLCRTHLTVLKDASAAYPSRSAFKVPQLASPESDEVAKWTSISYSRFERDVELYAAYWARVLQADALPPRTVVGLW